MRRPSLSIVTSAATAAVALTLVSVSAQPPQVRRPADQVFRAAVEMVSLNVTVTDQKQHYLTDLDSKDFTILEDGNAQSKIRQGVTTEVLGESTSPGPYQGKLPAKSMRVNSGSAFSKLVCRPANPICCSSMP